MCWHLCCLRKNHVGRPKEIQRKSKGYPRVPKGHPRNVQGTLNNTTNTNNTNTNGGNSNSKSTRGTGKGCFALQCCSRAALLPDSRYQVEWLVWQTQRALLELARVPLLYKGALAMHMYATWPISSHPQVATPWAKDSKSPGFKGSRTQGLKDSSTQGFKHSGTQAFMDRRTQWFRFAHLLTDQPCQTCSNSAFGFPKTRLTKTIVPKGWSSNIKLEKSKT